MDASLIAAVVGSLIVGGWLLFEVWVRRGDVQQLRFSELEERSGSEDTFWRVRVQVPTSHSLEDKWVWVSRKQFAGLEDQGSLPVHIRHFGGRTVVRGVNHWLRVWWLGFATLYFVVNLIDQVSQL